MPGIEIKGRSKIANYRHGGRAGYAIGGVIKGAQKIISKIKPKGKGLGSGIKPSEAKDILKSDKITRSEYLKQWSPYFGGRSLKQEMKETAKKGKAKGGRAGYAIGGAAAKVARTLGKKFKKKKKVYPETEDLTHQKGPYVGDVGSERPGRLKRREWKKPIGKFPPEEGRKMKKPIGKFPPEEGRKMQPLKEGGKSDKKWIQKAVNPKHKGYCTPMTKKTCTPARKALARTFKKKAKTGWG
jgi:hypothetical protein